MAAARSPVAYFVGLCCALAARAAPLVAVGSSMTCAMKEGEVKCWGTRDKLPYPAELPAAWWMDLSDGLLGNNETEVPGNMPAVNFGNRSVVDITCGRVVCCALDTNQDVTCWGRVFDWLTVDVESEPPLDLGTGRKVAELQAGHSHGCALLTTGEVLCYGGGFFGQLGFASSDFELPGDNLKVVDFGSNRRATALAVGAHSNCALLSDGEVRCWGANTGGLLGQESNSFVWGNGKFFGEQGANWPATTLPSGLSVLKLTVGSKSACALMSDDKVYCWGGCLGGECGISAVSVGESPGTMGDNMVAVNISQGIRDVAIGFPSTGFADFTCVITLNNETRCFGLDGRFVPAQEEARRLAGSAGAADDVMPCYGGLDGKDKVLDFGAGRYAVKLFMGRTTTMTCALLNTDEVACWGATAMGEHGGGKWGASGKQTYGCTDAEWGDDGVHILMLDPLTTTSTSTSSTTSTTTTTTTTVTTSTSTATTSTGTTSTFTATTTSQTTGTTSTSTGTTTSTSTASSTTTFSITTTTVTTITTTTTTTTSMAAMSEIDGTTRSVAFLCATVLLLVAAAVDVAAVP